MAGTITFGSKDLQAARLLGGQAYVDMLGCPCPPSLDLRMKDWETETNGYRDVTFTRATIATRVTPQGLIEQVGSGVLRHHYAPVTGEYLGILVEEERTNLCLFSQSPATVEALTYTAIGGTFQVGETIEGGTSSETAVVTAVVGTTVLGIHSRSGAFTLAGETLTGLTSGATGTYASVATRWEKIMSNITADAVVAPDGTQTADKLYDDATAGTTHFVQQKITVALDTVHCLSVFLKAGEYSKARIRFLGVTTSTNSIHVDVDLSAGTVSAGTATGEGSVTATGIEAFPNGWYRVWISGKFSTTQTDARVAVFLDNGTSTSYDGDGSSGLYIWGAQLTTGAFSTSYVPTTSATVTRNVDVVRMTGADFTKWYNQDEGTFYAEYQAVAATGQRVWSVSDGTLDERMDNVFTTSGSIGSGSLYIVDGGVVQVAALPAQITPVSGTFYKHSCAYKKDDFAGSRDGETVVTDTSGTIPTVNKMYIGGHSTSVFGFNGTIRQLTYFPRKLSNALLQTLSKP